MLERPEAAAVAFATGVVIILVGLIGVSSSPGINLGFIIIGAVVAVLAIVWWQVLRRANQ